MKIGIACSAGGPKGVFVHGVLDAFAEAGFKAHPYGAASSTAIVAAFAATEQLRMLRGSAHWKELHARRVRNDYDIGKTLLESVSKATATLSVKLFNSDSAARRSSMRCDNERSRSVDPGASSKAAGSAINYFDA